MKKQKRIVTLGGGTGSYTLLSGLKKHPVDITAIVSMADDGGSTGRLRDELGVLPPGDVRQCLVALSGASTQLRELMQYRFRGGDLRGHNFGNIFLSALEKLHGSMSKGLIEAQKILAVQGKVVPITEGNMRLVSTLANGDVLHGEDVLDCNETLRKDGVQLVDIHLAKKVEATKSALSAVQRAHTIVLGPADHFSNTIPCLLVGGFADAIRKSRARVVYVANLTNKRGLTDGWTVADYIVDIEQYIGKGRIHAVLYNTTEVPKKLLRRYEKQEGKGSLVQLGDMSQTCTVYAQDLLHVHAVGKRAGDSIAHTRSFIRHDSEKLADALFESM
jgi:uncharacterized cofD-like protein